jgi:D-alanyl-lipoteichoic acid acyltransferase DltB (MBOAT superfamily)
LWGLFKKVVIADNCAEIVNTIFDINVPFSGSTNLLGALLFTFQIYCDFSGYSDIAIGTARLFGLDLLRNFAYPYFSRDIAEFWRRWHISLSSWFKDYIYIPLGGSRVGTISKIRNILIIFTVSGFWHGANWTFIIWGLLNAIYTLPSVLMKSNRIHIDIVAKGKTFPTIKEFVSILYTFILTVFAWIFFRAINLTHALQYCSKIFSKSLFVVPNFPGIGATPAITIIIIGFLLVEWIGREDQFAIAKFGFGWNRFVRLAFYSFIIFLIGFYIHIGVTPFIYFQF